MTEHQYYDNLYGQARFGQARMDLPETLSNTGDLILGTRHLIRIIDSQGVRRVAKYCQWDGYPSGNGVGLLKYMHQLNFEDAASRADFDSMLQKTKFIDEVEAGGIDNAIKAQGLKMSQIPALSRDTSDEMLLIIAGQYDDSMAAAAHDSEGRLRLQDTNEFGLDTIMCEWVYEINMSALDGVGTFSVRQDDKSPVIATFRLDQLPDRATFLAMVEETANALYEED